VTQRLMTALLHARPRMTICMAVPCQSNEISLVSCLIVVQRATAGRHGFLGHETTNTMVLEPGQHAIRVDYSQVSA